MVGSANRLYPSSWLRTHALDERVGGRVKGEEDRERPVVLLARGTRGRRLPSLDARM